jgi:hypothetical protein
MVYLGCCSVEERVRHSAHFDSSCFMDADSLVCPSVVSPPSVDYLVSLAHIASVTGK